MRMSCNSGACAAGVLERWTNDEARWSASGPFLILGPDRLALFPLILVAVAFSRRLRSPLALQVATTRIIWRKVAVGLFGDVVEALQVGSHLQERHRRNDCAERNDY